MAFLDRPIDPMRIWGTVDGPIVFEFAGNAGSECVPTQMVVAGSWPALLVVGVFDKHVSGYMKVG